MRDTDGDRLTTHAHYAALRAYLDNQLRRKRAALQTARPEHRRKLEREIAEVKAQIASVDFLWAALANGTPGGV